ncbi:hypothetical protein LINPERPRIM_LOCUS30961 [Linum perenne]
MVQVGKPIIPNGLGQHRPVFLPLPGAKGLSLFCETSLTLCPLL